MVVLVCGEINKNIALHCVVIRSLSVNIQFGLYTVTAQHQCRPRKSWSKKTTIVPSGWEFDLCFRVTSCRNFQYFIFFHTSYQPFLRASNLGGTIVICVVFFKKNDFILPKTCVSIFECCVYN